MSVKRSQVRAAMAGYRKQGGLWKPPPSPPPGPPVLPSSNLEARFLASSVVVTGTDVDSWPDETGNGHDASPTGTKATLTVVPATAIPAVQFGAAPAYDLATGITQVGTGTGGEWTIYSVIYTAPYASALLCYGLDGSNFRPLWRATIDLYVHDSANMRGEVTIPSDTLVVLRTRTNATPRTENKVTGYAAVGFAETRTTDVVLTRLGGGNPNNYFQVEHLFYNEDTVVSGQDVDIQAYIFEVYGV